MFLQFHAPSNTFFMKPCAGWEALREAGFTWNGEKRVWVTRNLDIASKFQEHASSEAARALERFTIALEPYTAKLPVPRGLTLKEHQELGARFSLSRRVSYLAFDPGTGKTIIAAIVSAVLGKVYSITYVCPPSLTANVKAEFKRWAPQLRVGGVKDEGIDVLLIPDTMLEKSLERIAEHVSGLDALLIVDEAHRFKETKAKRTRAMLGATKRSKALVDIFSRVVFMSGTPILNRPIELYPALSKLAPQLIDNMTKYDFGMRYCAGQETNFGVDFRGHSNLDELSARIHGKFMLRVEKSVLNLPPKTEEVFILTGCLSAKAAKLSYSILKHIGYEKADPDNPEVGALILNGKLIDRHALHVATYRRMVGTEKAKLAVPFIKEILEGDEAVIVFAFHVEAIEILKKELATFKPFVIDGGTKREHRQNLVNEFQESKTRNLFIGSYIAMGEGFTLTKATRVVFVEYDWVPGRNTQASDRAHRIGQEKPVLVQYLTVPNSIDSAVLTAILNKREAIKRI